MGTQRRLKDVLNTTHLQGFKELTRHVLNSMMGYIPLQSILQKVIQDPTYSSGKFGEVKDLLLGMLDTYNYETTLLHTCNNLVNHDLYHQLSILSVTASRGIVTKLEMCHLCSKSFMKVTDNDSVICFRCGHGYHMSCLQATGSMYIVDGDITWLCYKCNKTRRSGNVQAGRTLQRLPSSPHPQNIKTPGNKPKAEMSLMEPEQIQAIDNLRRVQKTNSRLAILSELARQERAGGMSKYKPPANSIFHNEQFQLRLAHPPPDFQ